MVSSGRQRDLDRARAYGHLPVDQGLHLQRHDSVVGPGKMTNREFNDAVLKENRIPIELIRASLTQQKLTRDYQSQWKFAGDL